MVDWSVMRRALRSPVAADAGIAILVAVVAYVVAHRSMAGFSAVPWIEDLLVPCTGRPGWVPDPVAVQALPQWQAFAARQVEFFPCEAINGMPLIEIGPTWRQSEYFHRLLALWFRWVGPTIQGFVGFQAAFHAATCAAAYLVFRLGLWRVVALAAAAGLVWSNALLAAVAMPIEYAKAPWLIAAVGLGGLLLRRDALGRSVWPTALALGLVTGVGIGFKTDLIAAVPLALAAALFVRGAPFGLSRKVTATACVVVGLVLGSGWVIYQSLGNAGGSALAVQILGGMDSQMEATYSVNPLYDYGLAFDDSHITVLLNTYGQRVLGTAVPVYFYSLEMQRASVALLREMWMTFPGDLVLRVIAAALRTVQLNTFGLPIAVAGLFVILVRNLRAGWLTTLAVVYLSAYVSLIFQRRHFYHLEFISWGLTGAVIQALCMPRRWLQDGSGDGHHAVSVARRFLAAGASLILIAGLAFAILTAARFQQQRSMIGLLETYAREPGERHDLTVVPSESGDTFVRIAGISAADDEPAWRSDQMRGDYTALTVGCIDDQPIPVTARYRPAGTAWERTFQVACLGAGTTSTLMLPIYQYGTTHRFDGLMLSARAAGSLQSVAVVTSELADRMWLPLQLPPDWRERSWFKTLRVPLVTP